MKARVENWASDGGPLSSARVLDYLAAYAPNEIPGWFVLETATPKPRTLSAEECLDRARFEGSRADRSLMVDWIRDGSYDMPTLTSEFARASAEAAQALFTSCREEAKAWEDAYTVDRYFAWRWFYAQMMLNNRPLTRGA